MPNCILGLGTNLGDRVSSLTSALYNIGLQLGEITHKSSVYETSAWGKTDEPNYLNQVISVHTLYTPECVLKVCQEIEILGGRERNVKWGARSIDIDVLYYDNLSLNSKDLVLPHPYIQDRKFVLIPLNEIAPSLIHPLLNKNTLQLLEACKDELKVEMYNNNNKQYEI